MSVVTCATQILDGTYIAERVKQIATPKKNVENTTTSAVVAVAYLGCKDQYTGKGRVKKITDPITWENMLTGAVLASSSTVVQT